MQIRHCILATLLCFCAPIWGQTQESFEVPLAEGTLQLLPLQDNAVRIRYVEGSTKELPEWVYTMEEKESPRCKQIQKDGEVIWQLKQMSVSVNTANGRVTARNDKDETIFSAYLHQLKDATVQQEPTREATLVFDSPEDEYLYGLGQFQDGYMNVRGLTRRLTQVNTQIAIPFLLSSRGYGLLWNNYGLTEFNPPTHSVKMDRAEKTGEEVTVNVTSTEGGRRETRQNNVFNGRIDIPQDGTYTILLDVGQKMARRHHLNIDGKNVIDVSNVWLPPTTSILMDLKAGTHMLTAELERGDKPTVYYKKVDNSTVLRSPVAECVDYTLFVGNADEVIASYRNVTGTASMLPKWAFGYIHCRERFHSQDELVETARRFRNEQIPLDLIVQDWQYWGKYGWNAMKFDEAHYPDPAKMVSDLHDMDMQLMLSVWSKIDPNSDLGKKAEEKKYYIPETSWIDFFNPEASSFYWKNFSERLLKPYRIDAWWQDATEPENDDLEGRRIINNQYPGEIFRNVYPLKVCETVYNGLRADDPDRRAMIFTRSGFPGAQRYNSVFWSGDVGNDWKTLRYQLAAGLNFVATGLPWWTYDAGGFFRPADQYTNADYIERMIRWIQAGTFLPLMRVHGYMSNTEPWQYGKEAQRIITNFIEFRYRLLPYIYSEAARVTSEGYTLMRPFVFDFPNDSQALEQEQEYMFGEAILVNPVTEKGVTEWSTYLPQHPAGWYDMATARWYEGGQTVTTPVSIESIPLFAKGGSIIPIGPVRQSTAEKSDKPTDIYIIPGDNATFTLYEDEGTNYNYEKGEYSTIPFNWNNDKQQLTIGKRAGGFEGMEQEKTFIVHLGKETKTIRYTGKKVNIKF